MATAEKKGLLLPEHQGIAAAQMMRLNKVGEQLGKVQGVTALTDVTGFGLLGHLAEMTEGSGLTALISFEQVPLIIDELRHYIDLQSVPGGTGRNWESYGEKIGPLDPYQKAILADPQTSGGLLVAVKPSSIEEVREIFRHNGLEQFLTPIGEMVQRQKKLIYVESLLPA